MKLPGWNVGTFAVGAAVVFFGPALLGVAGGLARSFAKAGIKSGMLVYERGREIAVDAKETMGDLASEARSEVSAQEKPKSAKK